MEENEYFPHGKESLYISFFCWDFQGPPTEMK
jgi:hypothetical protein